MALLPIIPMIPSFVAFTAVRDQKYFVTLQVVTQAPSMLLKQGKKMLPLF